MTKIIFSFILFALLFSSCFNYDFTSSVDEKHETKRPCKAKVRINFKENTENNYLLIGICEAKTNKRRTGNHRINKVLEELQECACMNGGDFVKIMCDEELKGDNSRKITMNELNAKISRNLSQNTVVAEVYVKIN